MTREDVLKSPEYWTAAIQTALYNCAEEFMRENGMNRTQLADYLGVSKGYVTQILNGDYDHRLSKMMELALAFGRVPKFSLVPVSDYVRRDTVRMYGGAAGIRYSVEGISRNMVTSARDWSHSVADFKKVA